MFAQTIGVLCRGKFARLDDLSVAMSLHNMYRVTKLKACLNWTNVSFLHWNFFSAGLSVMNLAGQCGSLNHEFLAHARACV